LSGAAKALNHFSHHALPLPPPRLGHQHIESIHFGAPLLESFLPLAMRAQQLYVASLFER
jgi:hypothetical protein